MSIEEIAEEIKNCKKCNLWGSRHNTVPGEGDPNAKIMIVGEAPGRSEDMQGRPFVGPAGKILDRLLAGIGVERKSVFITSVLKCRPPGNRNPTEEEIQACAPFLNKQIKAISPAIVCTIGNVATQHMMQAFGLKPESIGQVHGRVFPINTLELHFKLLPTYHPAAIIYNPGLEQMLRRDFELLRPNQNL